MKGKEKMSFMYAKDLVKGVDFEIVSHIVVDKEGRIHTVESFFEVDQLEILNKAQTTTEFRETLIIQCLFNRNRDHYQYIERTGMIKKPVYFYRFNCLSIHHEWLISLGFGLVKILTGEAKGELWIYDSLYFENLLIEDGEDWDDPFIGNTLIRFAIYLSLINWFTDDRELEEIVYTYEDQLKDLCLCNAEKIIEKLKENFALRKGGDNVIPFPIQKG